MDEEESRVEARVLRVVANVQRREERVVVVPLVVHSSSQERGAVFVPPSFLAVDTRTRPTPVAPGTLPCAVESQVRKRTEGASRAQGG